MHNGDMGRARAAWEKICQLGRYGNIPITYEGGLDVKGLKIALDEQKTGESEQYAIKTYAAGKGGTDAPQMSVTLSDDIKRIEDLAAGDKPA